MDGVSFYQTEVGGRRGRETEGGREERMGWEGGKVCRREGRRGGQEREGGRE